MRQSGKPAKSIPIAEQTREQRITEATASLIAMGATLRHESESGSRYFELPGGLQVRVADHAPNENTANWMERREVAAVRIDQPDWQEQLERITGPSTESE